MPAAGLLAWPRPQAQFITHSSDVKHGRTEPGRDALLALHGEPADAPGEHVRTARGEPPTCSRIEDAAVSQREKMSFMQGTMTLDNTRSLPSTITSLCVMHKI